MSAKDFPWRPGSIVTYTSKSERQTIRTTVLKVFAAGINVVLLVRRPRVPHTEINCTGALSASTTDTTELCVLKFSDPRWPEGREVIWDLPPWSASFERRLLSRITSNTIEDNFRITERVFKKGKYKGISCIQKHNALTDQLLVLCEAWMANRPRCNNKVVSHHQDEDATAFIPANEPTCIPVFDPPSTTALPYPAAQILGMSRSDCSLDKIYDNEPPVSQSNDTQSGQDCTEHGCTATDDRPEAIPVGATCNPQRSSAPSLQLSPGRSPWGSFSHRNFSHSTLSKISAAEQLLPHSQSTHAVIDNDQIPEQSAQPTSDAAIDLFREVNYTIAQVDEHIHECEGLMKVASTKMKVAPELLDHVTVHAPSILSGEASLQFDRPGLLLEYLPGKRLTDVMQDTLSNAELREIQYAINKAVHAMADNNYQHGDIHDENILLHKVKNNSTSGYYAYFVDHGRWLHRSSRAARSIDPEQKVIDAMLDGRWDHEVEWMLEDHASGRFYIVRDKPAITDAWQMIMSRLVWTSLPWRGHTGKVLWLQRYNLSISVQEIMMAELRNCYVADTEEEAVIAARDWAHRVLLRISPLLGLSERDGCAWILEALQCGANTRLPALPTQSNGQETLGRDNTSSTHQSKLPTPPDSPEEDKALKISSFD